MVIDFKKNTSHNNKDQLLIFIYLFITSYLMSAFLIGCTVSSAFLCESCFFLCYRRQLKAHLHNNNASFCSCLFHLCISKVSCYEENLPQSIEATCVLWPLQLYLGWRCWLLPACTERSVRQRSRGNSGINDYLWSATSHPLTYPQAPFITAAGCHCGGKKHARTNAKYCNVCTHAPPSHKHTGSLLLVSLLSIATYPWHILLSCHQFCWTNRSGELNSPNITPPHAVLWKAKTTPHPLPEKSDATRLMFPRFALSGTWLTCLCDICLSLHVSCFPLCQTSSSWT